MKLITTALCAIITGIMMIWFYALMTLPVHADIATDYYDNDVSAKISAEWQRQASIKYGDTPREPTTEELQYMQQFTAQKQAELDGARK